jgi:flagellar basal-body rod protein FlgG
MAMPINVASTGMQAQQLKVTVIANNIANVNTTAYPRQRAEFQDLFYQNKQRMGATSADANTKIPSGIQLGLGVNVGSIYRINEQGDLQMTDNDTDVAIKGNGYFQIEMPDGSYSYTRDGSFQLNATGQLVTARGLVVAPGITVPLDHVPPININDVGQVSIKSSSSVNMTTLGTINMVGFINPKGLEAIGDNLFLETEASGPPVVGTAGTSSMGILKQGWLEGSNVNTITEMTDLIQAQRNYEMNSVVIQTAGQMEQKINEIRV